MGTKNKPGNFDCYANALPDEPMFILLGRDPQAPALVRAWADKRIFQETAKAEEAYKCALDMESFRKQIWLNIPKAVKCGSVLKFKTTCATRVVVSSITITETTIKVSIRPYTTDEETWDLENLVCTFVHDDGRPIAQTIST